MPSDALPPLFSGTAFLVADALPVLGRARLRRRDLSIPARGLRQPSSAQGDLDVEAFALLLSARQVFSHLTAAALWGLPLPSDGMLHVSTVGDGPVMRRHGVVGHRLDAGRASTDFVRGLPVTARVETWADCSILVPLDDLVAAGDFLVGRRCGHHLDELAAAVARRAGMRGARRLRAAFALVRVGSESPRETRLRLQLAREGVRPPLLNCEIWDDRSFIARCDLIFGRERVVVEYDGDQHRTDRKQYRDDKRRREALVDAGWHALHISDDDLDGENWRGFVVRLRRALARGDAVALGRRS